MKNRIAIIGAGISGLTLAQNLKDIADVVVYEKSRGVGGRMSTRYADPFHFDHGANSFTARTVAFQEFLKPYMEIGTIAEWNGQLINLEIGNKVTERLRLEPHLVASPTMNSLCKNLAEGIDVRLKVEIAPLTRKQPDTWMLRDKEGNEWGEHDWVISTAPSAQTLTLFQIALSDDCPLYASQMQGCYSLMIGFNKPWDKHWIAANVRDNPIKLISINSVKPGRNTDVSAIVAYSHNDWAEKHMDDDILQVQACLVRQFEAVTGIACDKADHISAHRWKYAIVEEGEKSGFYLEPQQKIAATSDWASRSRIEDVWLNAVSLANTIALTIR